jgi:hypothetical protein
MSLLFQVFVVSGLLPSDLAKKSREGCRGKRPSYYLVERRVELPEYTLPVLAGTLGSSQIAKTAKTHRVCTKTHRIMGYGPRHLCIFVHTLSAVNLLRIRN